jgi:hypothetical protein
VPQEGQRHSHLGDGAQSGPAAAMALAALLGAIGVLGMPGRRGEREEGWPPTVTNFKGAKCRRTSTVGHLNRGVLTRGPAGPCPRADARIRGPGSSSSPFPLSTKMVRISGREGPLWDGE